MGHYKPHINIDSDIDKSPDQTDRAQSRSLLQITDSDSTAFVKVRFII